MKENGNRFKKQKLRRAIFLDRDGTIIKFEDLVTKPSQLRLLPRAAETINKFNKLGFLVIVVTNQPVVARGLITPKGIDDLHEILIKRFKRSKAHIDAFYFCPHHPEATLKKYRVVCFCRKPSPGMLKQAIKKFNIDPRKSFMIGDSVIDVVSGKRAGLKTILVKTGPGHSRLDRIYENKVRPDFKAKNLIEAVKIIKNKC
ncbi:MAG: HAD family hydrolase [Patescibacteria group bacterium]